jgi:uncharacterized protein YjbI with pentapeptide repeats
MVHSKEATMESTARLRKRVLMGLGAVALLFLAFGALPIGDYLKGLFLNLGTELVGAAATYYVLDLLIGSRERREAEEEELAAKKADLIARMGSQVQDVAVAAAEELRRHGWLTDGSLRGAYLRFANLQGADLFRAKLQEADLMMANLQGANLGAAHLQKASLCAYLQKASLTAAYLQEASLFGADLREASLSWAYLEGANLQGAKLQGANLEGTHFSEDTILPDRTKWTSDTDMARFTDPDHPDFWRTGA